MSATERTATAAASSLASKGVRPDEVEVSCEKAGYRQANVIRRANTQDTSVETNCTLQRL
jgi:hypothetical protein